MLVNSSDYFRHIERFALIIIEFMSLGKLSLLFKIVSQTSFFSLV